MKKNLISRASWLADKLSHVTQIPEPALLTPRTPSAISIPPPGSAILAYDGVWGTHKWRAIMDTDYSGIIRKAAVFGISLVTTGGNHG